MWRFHSLWQVECLDRFTRIVEAEAGARAGPKSNIGRMISRRGQYSPPSCQERVKKRDRMSRGVPIFLGNSEKMRHEVTLVFGSGRRNRNGSRSWNGRRRTDCALPAEGWLRTKAGSHPRACRDVDPVQCLT